MYCIVAAVHHAFSTVALFCWNAEAMSTVKPSKEVRFIIIQMVTNVGKGLCGYSPAYALSMSTSSLYDGKILSCRDAK